MQGETKPREAAGVWAALPLDTGPSGGNRGEAELLWRPLRTPDSKVKVGLCGG